MRYWIKFTKEGLQKYISHRDMLKVMSRSMRRAGIPVASSQGYNPHPLISFSPPLELGVASKTEYMDVKLSSEYNVDELCSVLNAHLPKGFRVIEGKEVTKKVPSLMAWIEKAVYSIEFAEFDAELEQAISAIIQQESIIIEKENRRGKRQVDVRDWIHTIDLVDNQFMRVCLQTGQNGNLKVSQFIALLTQYLNKDIYHFTAVRLALLGLIKDEYVSPWELLK